jgi:hypothetical protein
MATLGATYLNLMDLVQREKPDHTVATVCEILNQQNPALQDIAWKVCNDGSQNITHYRTKLPSASLLQVGAGIPLDKSNVSQTTDTTARIGVASEVSKRLAEFNGNSAAQRALEARAMLEAMNQKMMNLWFYGNAQGSATTIGLPGTRDPLGFDGLSYRYGTISGAANAEQIIDAGGTENNGNTSIWMVVNGPKTISGLIPQGAVAGVKHTPFNGGMPVSKTLSSGNIEEVYQDAWEWHTGLCVEDWRGAVRIANIDVSNLTSESSAADLIKLMIKAQHRLEPVERLGVPTIYCTRTVAQMLDIQALGKAAGNLTIETVDGKKKTSFRGYPIRVVHALSDAEARVV